MESWRKIAMAEIVGIGLVLQPACPQTANTASSQLNVSGQVVFAGQMTPYVIRRLPVSSFPELPETVVGFLDRRGCFIPQTYEAHRPENVVHASLERAGSSDWAVLCSAKGTVSLLVFFGDAPAQFVVLASAPETVRLQAHDATVVLGFNWGIDPASPVRIHQAQAGMEHRPAIADHDALADSVVDQRTIYHFYAKSTWTLVDLPN